MCEKEAIEKTYRQYVDIHGLAKEILEKSKDIEIKGIEVKPWELVIRRLAEFMALDIGAEISKIQIVEAKLERIKEEKEVKEE